MNSIPNCLKILPKHLFLLLLFICYFNTLAAALQSFSVELQWF
ncbi:MAG: hypothetical protein ACPGVB_14775 [Chitinophagales bacterium]